MAFMQKGSTTFERSARSVFVGNISYDVTEEQIKQVFSKVGQIVHFRLVHDRDTGRPKGFGFCEFNDASTAAAAIRLFNGHDLNGRPLRVDSAASSERNMEEAQQIQAAAQSIREPAPRPVEENPYGKEPEPGKATEAIAKAVAAMPPEQMFELMKQMKQNVITNPVPTRHLLMENPQLAYALLQAQVVMRVVDPKVAYSMLHREVPTTQQPFHQQQQPPASSTNGSAPPQKQFRSHGPPPPSANTGIQNHGFSSGIPSSTFAAPHYNANPVMPMQAAGPINPPSSSVLQPSSSNNPADEEKNQAEMLLRVINLTDEQINLLPPDDRIKVMELRNQLRHRVGNERNL
ncbi:RRM domain-containing protein [Aphelenchoides bicaudatus]|nr:RRM domain-containing protein [Aphelenchoides bicaudatus]